MLTQLIPLLVVGSIFSVYGVVQAVRYVWSESLILAADRHVPLDFGHIISDLEPIETPLSRLLKDPNA